MFDVALLVAVVVPLAVVSVLHRGGAASSLSAREPRIARHRALAVAAVMSVVAASAVSAGPSVAQESDMHVFYGTVTSADGAPLAGMKVSVFCVSCAEEPTSDPSRDAARPWPAEQWGSGAQLLGEATTGASGDWSVWVAEPESGSPLVIAWDPDGDHAFAEVEGLQGWADTGGLETSLVVGGRLSGRIVAGGGAPPTEGFVLIGRAEWGDLLYYGFSLVVSDDGDYLTPGLPDGDYALRYPGGRYPGSLEAPYVAGGLFTLGTISGGHDTSADHSLAQYSSISGRVTDRSSNGLGGVSVYASPVGAAVSKFYASPVGGWSYATTSDDGTYTIDSVVPDLYVLSFEPADDTHAADYLVADVPNVGGQRGVDVQLGPGGTISGHVRHVETGEPEANANVRLCLDGPDTECVRRWWTNDEGYFEFVGVAARSYRLSVYQSPPLHDVEKAIVLDEGGHEEVEFRIGFRGAFRDDEGAFSEEALDSLEMRGILAGTECGRATICPDDAITRATMAVWLGRALTGEEPQPIESSRFADVVAWSRDAAHIERFADLGVTEGCGGSRFCPDDAVTRAQMAVFLSRAYNLDEGPDPNFSDVPHDAWYAPDVAKIAAVGITAGCTTDPPGYCPERPVTRGEMAVFIHRALETLAGVGQP